MVQMRNNVIRPGIIYLFLLIASAFSCRNEVESEPLVKTVRVEESDKASVAGYSCRVSAEDRSNVGFRVSGTIMRVCVDPGDRVYAGQALAYMDNRDYKVQLYATQAEYSQIEAEVGRVVAMYKEDAVAENDYDKARYGLMQIKQKLAHHTTQVEDCTLRSPMNGYVGEVKFHAGETVMAGMPVVSVFDGKGLLAGVQLSAEDYKRRNEIASAYAEFSILPGERFPLEMKSVSRMANLNQLYEAQFAFSKKTKAEITPGMTGKVFIRFGEKGSDGETVIPMNALFKRDGASCVFALKDGGNVLVVKPVGIKRILSDGNAVISGLDPGEEIVVAGVALLREGQKVRKIDAPSESNYGGLL